MRFFTGIHQPSDADNFEDAFISINRLRERRSDFRVNQWILDNGAFSQVAKYGEFKESVSDYARQIRRWKYCGNLLAAIAQDYMCSPFVLHRTGLTKNEHQKLTIKNYDALVHENTGVYIMPVLQGYDPEDYVNHINMYGDRLEDNMWVGVGSVAVRSHDTDAMEDILLSIKAVRPDLKLHGFGLKTTALENYVIRHCVYSADSMAWSFQARREGRNPNDWKEARRFSEKIRKAPVQMKMIF